MLKRRRGRMIFLYLSAAGCVLFFLAFSALTVSETQLEKSSRSAFERTVDTIVYKLQSDAAVSRTYLAQTEAGDRLILSIETNGIPLSFPGSWTPVTDRATLIAAAREQALNAYGLDLTLPPFSSLDSSRTFELCGEQNERYLVSVSLLSSEKGWYSLVALKDMRQEDGVLTRQRIIFLGLAAVSFVALWLLSHFFLSRLEQYERRSRKQVEFVAAASHELKAPLAVISASASALRLDPAQSGRFTASIELECSRLARLVDDLLLLAGADADTWSVRFSPVDLDTLLIECYDAYEPLSRQKKQNFSLQLPEDPLPSVSGDAQRIRQTLSILLDNAVCYTHPGGTICLRTVVSSHTLTIAVEDHGPGIPPESREHIFERFYRADRSHSDKNHFGLGLSIARELTALHGGRLLLKDTPGGGCTFLLELPL